MKTSRVSCCLIRQLPLWIGLTAAIVTYADQNLAGNVTVTGGTSTGNLNVTGSVDVDGPVVSFGTIGASTVGNSLIFSDSTATSGTTGDTLTFSANRTTASWLWLHNASKSAMRLNSLHQLLLYQSDGSTAGITLTPASNQISFGSATLTGSGANLTAGGALTVAGALTASSGIINTNGTLAGGSTGLNLSAGGANQNVTITPSGTGNTILNGNVGIGTANPGAYKLKVQGSYSTFSENAGVHAITIYPNHSGLNQIYSDYFSGSAALPLSLGSYPSTSALNILANGSVGIGTASPNQVLSVNGNLSLGDTGNFIMMGQSAYTGGGGYIFLKSTGDYGRDFNIQNYSNAAGWRTNLFVAGESGNIGIGTTTPGAALEVGGPLSGFPATSGTSQPKATARFGNSQSNGVLDIGVNSAGGAWLQYTDRLDLSQNFPLLLNPNGGNVGIGTTNPTQKLDVNGEVKVSGNLTTRSGPISYFGFGEVLVPALPANDLDLNRPNLSPSLGIYRINHHTGLSFSAHSYYGGIRFYSQGYSASNPNPFDSTTGAALAMTITNGNVGIGTANPTQKLSVAGTVRAYAVVVDTGWSDYVFDKDYRLAPLSEVEQQIKTEKHLPGIPSAADVAEHGVSLGDMQSKLLAKVEELTLHLIEQEKIMNAQSKLIDAQSVRIQKLETISSSSRGLAP